MVRCFKCERQIDSVGPDVSDGSTWQCPSGVLFRGGSNFGSEFYDSGTNGVHVEIVVCDPCIEAARRTDRMREVVSSRGSTGRSVWKELSWSDEPAGRADG